MNLKGMRVLVAGLGKTGIATIRFLLKHGAKVKASDSKRAEEISGSLEELEKLNVEVETGGHRIETFMNCDLIVTSPGVPLKIDPIQEAASSGIEVISEIELAYRYLNCPIIAITGTNGKTTTTTLIGNILRDSGKKVWVGGNIGFPLIAGIDHGQKSEYVVAELSSFQLEGIKEFKPYISVLLNVSEDHLDRYDTFQDYLEAKTRIFLNQENADYAILNGDDPHVRGWADKIKAKKIYFSHSKIIEIGAHMENDLLVYRGLEGEIENINLNGTKVKGKHNRENIMVSMMVARICGCLPEKIQDTILKFPGLEHRMEFVKEIDQVAYYNDSKATNVGAMVMAMESFQEPIILIAGGKDKGLDFSPLKDLIKKRVKLLILFGEAREKINQILGNFTTTRLVGNLEEAVTLARAKASPNDVVLFSPGCASFDMFINYEERGKLFKNLVKNLN